ncbi:MAG TPA: class I SAM-dependent methyltransferase [Candidatus Udaeobacter sp.]
MNKAQPQTITGKIAATPNPLAPEQGSHVAVSWETNDPSGGEIRVATSAPEEKLVTRGGKSGRVEIHWIADSIEYEFRLYPASQPDRQLDSVKVRRDSNSSHPLLDEVALEVTRGNIDVTLLSRFLAKVLPRCLHTTNFPEIFRLWERHGFHVTPVHFYQPIPDTRSLPETLWDHPGKLVGIDMNETIQLDLLRNHFPKFRHEYDHFRVGPTGEPGHFYFNNGLFDGTDALVAYCMIRHFQPRLIVEVGSGFSSLVAAEAIAKNKDSALICIEPFPLDFLRQGFRGLQSLIEKKVEDLGLEFFSQLDSGDILFIDSSHTVKIGGDVNYLFLEVLPRLKPGVIVHVHDIFLPFDYRRDWVMDELRFWTEQYLLQAFLSFNSEFEVLMANTYLAHRYMEELKATFTNSPWWGGGSFWMRRRLGKTN